jgi:hypothetical protein
MLILIAFALGALFGWRRAAARGGDRRDRVQYAAAPGSAVALALRVGAMRVERRGRG